MNVSNSTYTGMYDIPLEDAAWMLTSAFIIFTMQTGFGLLETGCVSSKNEVNIMMKNVVDIFLGGVTYWLYGYGMSFGRSEYNNQFIALGDFALDVTNTDPLMGPIWTFFVFQLSFATTATTIVSGAMAERCDFKAYCLFSFLNTAVYCIPAGWVWGEHGFLGKMGAVDIAGSGVVHLTGGVTSLAAAMMLGPRIDRYKNGIESPSPGRPTSCAQGLFVLWWGWLAFNSGSTLGISGGRGEYAAKASAMTMISSFGGGTVGLFYSFYSRNGHCSMMDLVNTVLGALVAVTAGCFLFQAWDALLVGVIGGLLVCYCVPLFDILRIDDPVGATSVHGDTYENKFIVTMLLFAGICGFWGMIAVGLFATDPVPLTTTSGRRGLFRGGGWELLYIQTVTAVSIILWSFFATLVLLSFINMIYPLRLDPHSELIGADLAEHDVKPTQAEGLATLKARRAYVDDLENWIQRARNVKLGNNLRLSPRKPDELKNSRKDSLKNRVQKFRFRRRVSSTSSTDVYGNDFNHKRAIAWID